MRVLIAGSTLFNAGYRIDRALVRASAGQRGRDMHLLHVGRWTSGSARMAKEMADEFGWTVERVRTVSEAQADICLAFLHTDDERTAAHRIVMMKAEKSGVSVWRYHEGGPRHPHPQPQAFDPEAMFDFDPVLHDAEDRDLVPWEEALLPTITYDETVEFTLRADGTIVANWPTVA